MNGFLIHKIQDEIHIIDSGELHSSLWQFPANQKSPGDEPLNLFSTWDNRLKISPVFAMRYSSNGFEIDSTHIQSSVLWLSPGLKIKTTQPVISPYTGILLHIWAEFYKHSAYNLSSSTFIENKGEILFKHNPYLSNEFYSASIKPDNGIDFDESKGGIALLAPSFTMKFGKYNSSVGPFIRGNLALSRFIPSFPQLNIRYHFSDKWEFTFITGELYSGIPDVNYALLNEPSHSNRYINLNRYIAHHRLDLILSRQFRLGFYEQVIFGGRSYPATYLNPFQLFWSAQHEQGDLGNVQMGFDLDLLFPEGRFNLALLIDEWAPYSTFDMDNHHNWFAVQTGFSKRSLIKNKPIFIRMEISTLAPQIYTHRFDPNVAEASHHGYPIGFWSGGNSLDLWLLVYIQNSPEIHSRLEFESTYSGEPEYSIGKQFLSGTIKKRNKIKYELNYKLKDFFWADIIAGYYFTHLIYSPENFFQFQVQFRYNISY